MRLISRIVPFAIGQLILVLSLCVTTVWAQAGATTASVSGNVTDEQGAAIGNVLVSARDLATNTVREAVTDDRGGYLILQLKPGKYEIKATYEGFKTSVNIVDIFLGTTALVDFALQLGAASEVIEVSAGNLYDVARTENSTNIERLSIDGLPINRRNFLDFSLTTPRVTPDAVPQQGIIPASGLSFNGQNSRLNNFTIDGLDNNDVGSNAVRATVSQDAVQEFQVVSDNFSPEFGRAIGGVVNIVTRGGGNEFHGRLFFLNRNDTIAARDPFATIKPEFKQYQFGSTLSGPIKKDRAFFFTSFERLSIKQNSIVTISDPTVASARRLGFTLNNGPIPFSEGLSTVLARGDIQLTPSHRLNIRYNYGGTYNGFLEAFGGIVGETSSGIGRIDDNTIAVSETYINTGLNLVNEARFIYARRRLAFLEGSRETRVQVIAPEGAVTFGRSFFLPQPDREMDIVQIVNNVSLTRGRHQIKFGIDFETFPNRATLAFAGSGLGVFVPVDFSAVLGMPGLPFFTGLQNFDPSLRTPEQRAFLSFLSTVLPGVIPGFPQGVPLADLSIPIVFVQGFGDGKINVRTNLFGSFFQDEIRVNPKLLVKLGLRYDRNTQDFTPDRDGIISPRIALSYSITNNLQMRAAYGIFTGTLNAAFNSPVQILQEKQVTPIVLPFPFSILPFSLPDHRFPISKTVPAGVPVIQQLGQELQIQPDFHDSYSHQATLGFDYRIGRNGLVSVNYNLARGVRLLGVRNINPVVRPIADPVTNAITGRVDTARGDVFEFATTFDSYYHGFTVALNQRISNSFTLLAHYTFSKAIDNVEDINFGVVGFNNPLRLDLERSLSTQDVRNRFVTSGVFDLSLFKNRVLDGLQLSTIVTLNSGRPYNLLAGVDLNQNGDNGQFDRPTSLGRNTGIRPGFANVDLRLQRTLKLSERVSVVGFAEGFNLFNRVNINEIDRTFPPDVQGRFNLPPQEDGRFITTEDRFRSAFAPRQFQFGFRLLF